MVSYWPSSPQSALCGYHTFEAIFVWLNYLVFYQQTTLSNSTIVRYFDPTAFKISFLVGDIISNRLPAHLPHPDLTGEESEQLRAQLPTKISWLREFGEPERSNKEQKFIDRVVESLNNDDHRLSRIDKGKGWKRKWRRGIWEFLLRSRMSRALQ